MHACNWTHTEMAFISYFTPRITLTWKFVNNKIRNNMTTDVINLNILSLQVFFQAESFSLVYKI